MPRRGLPQTMRMRHDEHYVETLTASSGTPIGRLIPIEKIDPNPDQPRQVMGDLSELMASIAEKGIIEPLIVRQQGARYQIIAGERRYQAAVQVGLPELPVIIREADESELLELALIENIQRKDLTPFEESEALHGLVDGFNYTHEQLAKRLGKSRTTVTELLTLQDIPEDIRNLCRLADITTKSVLLEIVRQREPQKMISLIESLTRTGDVTRAKMREVKAKTRTPKTARRYTYSYIPIDKKYNLKLSFKKKNVPIEEVITAVEQILEDLKTKKDELS